MEQTALIRRIECKSADGSNKLKKRMNSLRILHIITRLDKGGSAENTLLTAIGSRLRGHRVEIICGISDLPPSSNENEAEQIGIKIKRFDNLVREISPLRDIIIVFQLYSYLKKNPCDILHTHTSKAGIVGRIAGIFAGVRCIIHTPHGHIFYGYFSPLKTKILIVLERIVTYKTTLLITLTESERRDYLDRRIGKPDRIVPVLSGIDLTPYLRDDRDKNSLRRNLGLPVDKYIIGTVARLDPVKNHQLIISAAGILKPKYQNIIFVFVGDGILRNQLTERIRSLNLIDRVIILGWRDDIPRLLKAFDLFVMCSLNEGMGRAFVEAQASGLQIIGSRVGGIAEVILVGVTGRLVSPYDYKELAAAIEDMYNKRRNAAENARLCRQWVNPRFSKEVMIDTIEKLYNKYAYKRYGKTRNGEVIGG